MNASNVFLAKYPKTKSYGNHESLIFFMCLKSLEDVGTNSAIIVSDVSFVPSFLRVAKLPSCLVQLHCLVFASSTVNFCFCKNRCS